MSSEQQGATHHHQYNKKDGSPAKSGSSLESVLASQLWFQGATKAGSSAATLLRGCAALSSRWLVVYLYQKDPKVLSMLLESMMNLLNREQARTTQLFLGIGLGSFIQAAAREGILETSEEVQLLCISHLWSTLKPDR